MASGVHNAGDTTTLASPSPGKSQEISLSPRALAEKIAFRDLVEAAGGYEAAALFCRLSKSQLHRCASRNCPDFAPIDVVSALEEITRGRTGWPHVTALHARERGLALMAMPDVGEIGPAQFTAALAEASREHADMATGLLDALADNDVNPEEADRLAAEALESAEAAMRVHLLLRQRAGRG